MVKDALQQVILRNNFYRDNFRRVVLILLISVILNVILLIGIFYMNASRPAPIYFASTNDGKLIPLASQSNPVLSDQAIIAWVNSAVPDVWAIDFLNYRNELNGVRKYFTDYGWQQFNQAFQPTLQQIITDQLVTKATPIDVPVITGSGLVNGVYSWRVQIPLLVVYQKGQQEQQKKVLWSLIVQRVNNNDGNDQLLGISQVVQTPLNQ